jgi:RNA polymerase sigma-70 factor (ECF subfamily)
MKAAALTYDALACEPQVSLFRKTREAFAPDVSCGSVARSPAIPVRTSPIQPVTDIGALPHEELVARIAAARDRAAFKQLFAYFAPRLKSYLISLGLDSEKAEDLAQDVMVTVWQKAEQFDPAKAKLSTWMFRIARNRFIDLKRRQKYPEVDADDHLKEFAAPETTDEPVIAGQASLRVRQALTALRPNQRQVIELSFFEELSHSQIAERLALPLGTVKSRIRIAFQTLRKELGEME